MNNEEICFIDTNFISYTPLTLDNLLEYFSSSPFYDKTSNNEILKMQYLHSPVPIEKLSKMKGIRYEVKLYQKTFVIEKIKDSATVLEIYFVLNNFIFKCPTESLIYKRRSFNFLVAMNRALDLKYEIEKPTLLNDVNSVVGDEVVDSSVEIINCYNLM